MIRINRASVPTIELPVTRAMPVIVSAAHAQTGAPPAPITQFASMGRTPKPKKQTKADRWADAIAAARIAVADLEAIRDELQEWYDNMPEGLQGSSKGEAVQEVAGSCEEAVDALNEALEQAEGIEFSY